MRSKWVTAGCRDLGVHIRGGMYKAQSKNGSSNPFILRFSNED